MFNNIVVIRSGGDLGSAVAHKLHRSGFKILILETQNPQAIRRRVAFSEAIFDGETRVEGILCKRVESIIDINECWQNNIIPIIIDEKCNVLEKIQVEILIDAILAKKNTGTFMGMAPLTIGLGPGFVAGKDVHVVVETQRGHNLGRIIEHGSAEENTGIPGIILGYTEERILRAPCSGVVKVIKDIGEIVCMGEDVLYVGGERVKSQIDGVVRGCIKEGSEVQFGMKIGDVDPRGTVMNCFTISDKARCIAGGVLEAILCYIS